MNRAQVASLEAGVASLEAALAAERERAVKAAKAAEKADADMAGRFKKASEMLAERAVRPNMLLAAAKIAKNDLAPAMPVQDKVIDDLTAIGKFLRETIAAAAENKE